MSASELAHRWSTASVTVQDAAGHALAGREVVVQQSAHAFGFGNIGFDFVGQDVGDEFAARFLELFNWATLPYYWGDFEPEPGRPRSAALLAAARELTGRGIRVKGHPLVWHTLAPAWLLDRPLPDVERAIRERIRRDVRDGRGLISAWDAINETVIMPVFENGDNAITRLAADRGVQELIALAFQEAHESDPDAQLLINDFDLSQDYERVLETALEAGLPIDAIGLQTHMHQGFRGETRLLEIADRFARFGLPLHFTETTLLSGDPMPGHIVDLNDYIVDSWPSTPEGEARQADELERHYRTLVSHPAVESITYWGFTDAGAWLGAPAGLVRADGSPKPGYDRLHSLIKGEWWLPPTTLRADDDGVVEVRGFRGTYVVSAGGAEASFELGLADSVTATLG